MHVMKCLAIRSVTDNMTSLSNLIAFGVTLPA